MLCDMRVAAVEATFAHPEVKFGGPPLFTPLCWIVGDGIARDVFDLAAAGQPARLVALQGRRGRPVGAPSGPAHGRPARQPAAGATSVLVAAWGARASWRSTLSVSTRKPIPVSSSANPITIANSDTLSAK